MAVVAESYVLVHDLDFGFAFGVYGKVVHVSGMMAFGILQAVLLSIRIKMWAGRLEIRRIALRLLMEVQRVLPGRQVVEAKLHGNTRRCVRAITPYHPFAYTLALSILQFDGGLGYSRDRQGEDRQTQSDGKRKCLGDFHGTTL